MTVGLQWACGECGACKLHLNTKRFSIWHRTDRWRLSGRNARDVTVGRHFSLHRVIRTKPYLVKACRPGKERSVLENALPCAVMPFEGVRNAIGSEFDESTNFCNPRDRQERSVLAEFGTPTTSGDDSILAIPARVSWSLTLLDAVLSTLDWQPLHSVSVCASPACWPALLSGLISTALCSPPVPVEMVADCEHARRGLQRVNLAGHASIGHEAASGPRAVPGACIEWASPMAISQGRCRIRPEIHARLVGWRSSHV